MSITAKAAGGGFRDALRELDWPDCLGGQGLVEAILLYRHAYRVWDTLERAGKLKGEQAKATLAYLDTDPFYPTFIKLVLTRKGLARLEAAKRGDI